MVRVQETGDKWKTVHCPRCAQSYALLESSDTSHDILEEDLAFLLKALGSSHPFHPPWLLVRDPRGVLRAHLVRPS
jgi:hypothetical protein